MPYGAQNIIWTSPAGWGAFGSYSTPFQITLDVPTFPGASSGTVLVYLSAHMGAGTLARATYFTADGTNLGMTELDGAPDGSFGFLYGPVVDSFGDRQGALHLFATPGVGQGGGTIVLGDNSPLYPVSPGVNLVDQGVVIACAIDLGPGASVLFGGGTPLTRGPVASEGGSGGGSVWPSITIADPTNFGLAFAGAANWGGQTLQVGLNNTQVGGIPGWFDIVHDHQPPGFGFNGTTASLIGYDPSTLPPNLTGTWYMGVDEIWGSSAGIVYRPFARGRSSAQVIG